MNAVATGVVAARVRGSAAVSDSRRYAVALRSIRTPASVIEAIDARVTASARPSSRRVATRRAEPESARHVAPACARALQPCTRSSERASIPSHVAPSERLRQSNRLRDRSIDPGSAPLTATPAVSSFSLSYPSKRRRPPRIGASTFARPSPVSPRRYDASSSGASRAG